MISAWSIQLYQGMTIGGQLIVLKRFC